MEYLKFFGKIRIVFTTEFAMKFYIFISVDAETRQISKNIKIYRFYRMSDRILSIDIKDLIRFS